MKAPTSLPELRSLLGSDVHFVPCRWRTKKPKVKFTQTSFAETQTAEYLAHFEPGRTNIAVYLGKASAGLCTIDFDTDEALAAFLAVNPGLKKTTHTRGSRGGMLWIRISGSYPKSVNPAHKLFEWRADRRLSMIAGRHPKGMDYTLVVDAPPVVLPFAAIQWPEGWELPWMTNKGEDIASDLIKVYGDPFYANEEDRVYGLNERYWAALYATENRVIYDPDERTFFVYEARTGLWRPVTHDAIREAISARILAAGREANQPSLEVQITQTKMKSVVAALIGIAEKRNAFSNRKKIIHVANGVVRLTDDGDIQFGGFSPDDYSRNRSPYSYDEHAGCPRFLKELILSAVSPEDADLLQRWAGLALFGYNLPQRLLILDGTPNGGKGTLVRILQALVGVENSYQLRTECLQERFETYRYRGKTLLIGPDVPGDFLTRKGASMLKVLVGGDPISAEGKGLNGDFAMFGTFNIIMTCNSRLRIRLEDDAGAWRRRLLVVRYERPAPTKRILDFHETLLREEGSGILRWALAGFVKLQREFDEHGDFVLTEAQRARVDSLLAESDSLQIFVRERFERHAHGDVTNGEFQQAYADFCAGKGWNPLPITMIERMASDLMLENWHVSKSHSIARDGKNAIRGWRGVRLIQRGDRT